MNQKRSMNTYYFLSKFIRISGTILNSSIPKTVVARNIIKLMKKFAADGISFAITDGISDGWSSTSESLSNIEFPNMYITNWFNTLKT